MDMLYMYKEEFSLRDEIETFSNRQGEIDMVDNNHSSLGCMM